MKFTTQKYSQDLRRYYRLPAVKVSLTLVLSFFVIAIFITLALRPTIISITTLKKTIVESQETLQKLDSKVANLQRAATQFELVKSFLPILDINIPNNGAMYSPLTAAVENLSTQTGVQLESESIGSTLLFSRILSPFTPSKSQSVVALPFSARIVGNYPNVASFLTKLLSMERIVMIESVTITKEAGAKSSSATVALSISGSAYYLADEAQLLKSMPEKGTK